MTDDEKDKAWEGAYAALGRLLVHDQVLLLLRVVELLSLDGHTLKFDAGAVFIAGTTDADKADQIRALIDSWDEGEADSNAAEAAVFAARAMTCGWGSK